MVQEGRGCRTAPADGGAENGSGGRHISFRRSGETGETREKARRKWARRRFVSRQESRPAASTLIWACKMKLLVAFAAGNIAHVNLVQMKMLLLRISMKISNSRLELLDIFQSYVELQHDYNL